MLFQPVSMPTLGDGPFRTGALQRGLGATAGAPAALRLPGPAGRVDGAARRGIILRENGKGTRGAPGFCLQKGALTRCVPERCCFC
jgi:hypothetical protein